MYIYIIALLGASFMMSICYRNYDNIKMLNDFRIQNNMSVFSMSKTLVSTAYMFTCIKCLTYVQSIVNNWTIKKIEKNLYELNFIINNKHIRLLVKVKSGPNKILQITNDENDDVTDLIQPYFNYKYVGCTPDVYGYKSIEVLYVDGSEKIIRDEEFVN